MKPSDIINKISNVLGLPVSNFCELRELCIPPYKVCKQRSGVLDFDEVKKSYTALFHCNVTPSSVDALARSSSDSRLCFIEIKSWTKFANHNQLSEEIITQKAESYDLQKKFLDSCCICEETLGIHSILARSEFSVAFFLVSDVDNAQNDASFDLAVALNSLAISSSSWEEIYNKEMKKALNKVNNCDTYYLSCKDVDQYLNIV